MARSAKHIVLRYHRAFSQTDGVSKVVPYLLNSRQCQLVVASNALDHNRRLYSERKQSFFPKCDGIRRSPVQLWLDASSSSSTGLGRSAAVVVTDEKRLLARTKLDSIK